MRTPSRNNGTKSRGPTTPEGKRNSAGRNPHIRKILLPHESRAQFNELLKAITSEIQPRTHIERFMVERLAVAQWRQMRLWATESAAISHAVRTQDPFTAGEDNPTREALATHALGDKTNRSEMRYDRQFNRALEHLQKFRAHRSQQLTDNKETPDETEPTKP